MLSSIAQSVEQVKDYMPRKTTVHQLDHDPVMSLRADVSDIREDLRDMRDSQQKDTQHLHSRIDALGADVTAKIDDHGKQVMTVIEKGFEKIEASVKSTDTRLSTLENWRWMIVGAGIVVGFLVVDVIVKSPLGAIVFAWLKAAF